MNTNLMRPWYLALLEFEIASYGFDGIPFPQAFLLFPPLELFRRWRRPRRLRWRWIDFPVVTVLRAIKEALARVGQVLLAQVQAPLEVGIKGSKFCRDLIVCVAGEASGRREGTEGER